MLQVDEQQCTVKSVNVRAEQHGDRPVPACDVGILFETGCEVLDLFEEGLKDAFYTKDKKVQKPLPGTDDAVKGPRLRFNGKIGDLGINWEGIGYKAALTWGDMAGSVDVKLSAITVAKVKAELTDGGTVGLSLQLQCHPKQEHYGELASLIGREGVSLTLTPPTATELKKIEKSEKKKDGKKDDDAGK